MNDKEAEVLIDLRERLVRIETILKSQNYDGVRQTANEAKDMADKNAKDIAELKSYVKWIVTAIIGAFITSLVTLVIK